ncbi:MAG: CHAT domain-containing protein, partial [Nitrospirota bacterium]
MERKEDLEKLLRDRDKLDEALHQMREKVSVMFTDIKGSTDYFEKWGDIEGRLMVQRCNDIILPLIEKYGGIVKSIGDGLMAFYRDSESAVRTAIEIQQGLHDFNRGKDDKNQLHLRIGINSGVAFVENNDVSGDVVNVASRVESQADVNSIFITRTAYEDVKDSDDIICRFVGARQLKGKQDQVKLYKVVWSDEVVTADVVRGETALKPLPAVDEKVFNLEFQSEGEKIRVKSREGIKGEASTIQSYEEATISMGKANEYSNKIVDLLKRANRSGKVSKDILNSLKESGQLLYDELFPAKTKEQLNSTELDTLILNIDDRLIHIPWELVYDGKEFMCQKFNMGRVVSTRQELKGKRRDVHIPLKMLIVADPQNNLAASYNEGVRLRDKLDEREDLMNVSFKSASVKNDFMKSKLRYFDLLHYAGHADYNKDNPSESGFLLEDGKLKAKDVLGMAGQTPLPSFVFSNACHSGQTEEWKMEEEYEKVYGLANAFLIAGVRHYLG